jgi:hypothetical protein
VTHKVFVVVVVSSCRPGAKRQRAAGAVDSEDSVTLKEVRRSADFGAGM